MKNTIARYFSVDKGIQEISIGVREKNGEKIAEDITKLSVETLLNLANLTKKNWIEKCEISRFFQVSDNLTRIKDDTNWKIIQIVGNLGLNRKEGFWEYALVKFFARLAFPATNSKSLVCRTKGWQWYFEIMLRSMLDRLRNYNWISQ